ncbi:MAG: hypothetical protein HC839_03310 [Leptolyngbyaceae cyanobacterium RM2_2_21]|nr:hypothetical protein [Leptolyngbyaceae cyanobacterium RM2_2_21]
MIFYQNDSYGVHVKKSRVLNCRGDRSKLTVLGEVRCNARRLTGLKAGSSQIYCIFRPAA